MIKQRKLKNNIFSSSQTSKSINVKTSEHYTRRTQKTLHTISEQYANFDSYFPSLKKIEQNKQVNKMYQSYQMEKKAIQQGLLTPQHLTKYLQPKKHFDIKKEINFLKKAKFQSCIMKLRAANIILNGQKSQQAKNEIVQETIESKKGQQDDIEFITKMNQLQIKQRMGKLLKYKSAPFLNINLGENEIQNDCL